MAEIDAKVVEQLVARAAIQDALQRYCRAVDRIDIPLLATVFHDDAVVNNGAYDGDVHGFLANVGQRHPTVPRAFHLIGNIMIDFLSPTRAFVESYGLALEQHPGAGPGGATVDRVYRVRYGDVFERRGGDWRVADRILLFDHVLSAVVDPAVQPDNSGRLLGVRGSSDPIAAKRAALLAEG